MALVKGTNSYGTVAEADAYFSDRIDVAAWTDASAEEKAKALVTATKLLDEIEWPGRVVDVDQPLAFPRIGSYFDPKLGVEVIFDDVDPPSRLINACFELAYHLCNNDGLLDDTGSVKTINVGSITLENIMSANKMPHTVKSLIRPIRGQSAQNSWWRAN